MIFDVALEDQKTKTNQNHLNLVSVKCTKFPSFFFFF